MRGWKRWIAFLVSGAILICVIQFFKDHNMSWKPWNMPLSGQIIYLDAGHGGPDGGAGDKEALEKDIALAVTEKVRDYLQGQGAIVLMTREKDVDLAPSDMRSYRSRKTEDLKKRLQLVNESEADLFVSVHLNAIPSPRWRGAQTFYAPHMKENKKLAKALQAELVLNLENTTREAKAINHVYLLKYAKKPGALVEVGFLSNPAEKQDLMTEEYQEKVAASIYKGIMNYLDDKEG
ncbi:N-acetylmuramoyl-L-alanine amidase CwlD [Pseudobacillus badius]|uniref:N-acetylmuramoyl-L-alanine amidase CwlD n=1 Tax=Bacillus badius TaxID=1455 RepID=UPI0007B09CBF|nr:N-acetylmuramoyl-L-alanine amidase CwlD [Bacillus badius]KZO00534.1 N-acetylmuramoyl-L-alanine amidase CwlD [Bacillus badius]MED0668160.1 N-acetylmuramoyl-L-alanine amidase CwlD [Bacillus badius]OCS87316.1 N-acetylmuramoyl-L-alanine amidase CwlD [Bacillus badius]OVE48882.1 N-acetylmuramoyl-L-alanine amidase CwlD [Bacillus badius]TDW00754.1 N-acetylmuramoyl-L-alanine amidase [Bacillus badius]